jgi:hypothetical protein
MLTSIKQCKGLNSCILLMVTGGSDICVVPFVSGRRIASEAFSAGGYARRRNQMIWSWPRICLRLEPIPDLSDMTWVFRIHWTDAHEKKSDRAQIEKYMPLHQLETRARNVPPGRDANRFWLCIPLTVCALDMIRASQNTSEIRDASLCRVKKPSSGIKSRHGDRIWSSQFQNEAS